MRLLPEIFEAAIEAAATEGDDFVRVEDSPEHARLFETRSYDDFATGFNDAGADKEPLGTKLRIAHAASVGLEVGRFFLDVLGKGGLRIGIFGGDVAKTGHKGFDVAVVQ